MGNLSPLKIIYLKLHFGNGRHLIVAVFIVFLLFGFVVWAIVMVYTIENTALPRFYALMVAFYSAV